MAIVEVNVGRLRRLLTSDPHDNMERLRRMHVDRDIFDTAIVNLYRRSFADRKAKRR